MDDFLVLLQAKLDEAKSKGNVNADIKELQNQLDKLKVQVELDPKATQKLADSIGKLVNQKIVISNIGINQNNLSKTGQQIGQVISDSAEKAIGNVTSKNIGKYFRVSQSDSRQFQAEMEKLVSGWTNGKGKVTDINIQTRTSYDKDAGKNIERLHQATVTYKNELDEVIKKTIAWRQIGTTTNAKGEEVALRGFVEVAGQYSKAIDTVSAKTDSFAEKQQKAVASAKNALSSIESKLHDPNITKSLAGTDFNANGLNSQLEKVRSAISVLDNASRDTFTQAKIDVDTEITSLNNLISTLKNAEYAATSLRTKGLETTKDVYASKLDVLVTKMKSSGVYTNGFQSEVDNLKNILNNATDTSDLTTFLNGLDKLEAGYKRVEASAKAYNQAQKVGINVSGLQSKIANLQRISPEIDNFKTNINGADVTVQSLYKDLEKVNTQSDLSVIKEKWKAFTEAAKSAGIAVTDVGNSVSQSAKESSRLLKELEKSYQNIKNLQIRKSALDPIADSSKIAKLNEEIAKEKNNYNNAFRSASANGNFDISAWKEIKSAIDSATKSKIEYNNAEKTDYLNEQKTNLSNTLSTLKSSLIENGLYTDELKQKIETLESELVNISNKGDLSTFKANLKSIESEIGTLLQANEIQLSIDTGDYESKVTSLISKTEQWTDSNGNAKISTANLSASLNELNAASLSYSNNPTEATQKRLIASSEKLDAEYKKITNSVKTMNATMAKDSAIDSLRQKYQKFYDLNGKSHLKFGSELRSAMKELDSGAGVTNQRLQELKQNLVKIENQARSMGKLGKGFFQTIKDGMSSFSYWTSSTFLAMKMFNSVKGGVSSVRELDTALVDLKKTTTMTASELEKFYYDSNATAKEMGVTTKEILEQASAWSRLGFSSAEQATKMAKYSSMFNLISPGMDLDSSTDGLVSVMKAFKIGLEDTDDIVDGIMSKINIIGNTQAVNNSDIVEFLTRSSSAMAEANNSLEETIALGTAATEITRDAASVGNALKTVSMRIRGYDEETESYTNDVEQLSGKIADLTKTTATPGGISLFSDNAKTEFKSTKQLFDEISKIYSNLTDKTQAKLLEVLAGKRQGQIVGSILNNYESVENSMESMANSAGNADAEMSVVVDSLDYKLNRLKETGTSVAQNLFKREDMKTIVDGLTSVMDVISLLTSKLGLIKSIGLGAGLFAGFKNIGIFKKETIKSWFSGTRNSINNEVIQPFQNAQTVIDKYNLAIKYNSLTQSGWNRLLEQSDEGLKAYLLSIKGNTAYMSGYTASLQGSFKGYTQVSSAISQYNNLSEKGAEEQKGFATAVASTNSKLGNYLTNLNGANASMGGYVKYLIGATLRTIGLQTVTIALNTALSMGISFIISGVVSAISAWIHKTENMIKASDEALSKINSINDELKSNQKTVSDSAKRFAELSQSVDQLTGKNISLSTEDYEEFLNLSNQLAEIFPSLSRIYDENGNAIVQLSGNVDAIVGSLQSLMDAERELANREISKELPDVFDRVKAKSDEYKKELEELEAQRNEYASALETISNGDYYELVSRDAEEYAQVASEIEKILENAGATYKRFDDQYQSVGIDANGNTIFEHKAGFEIIDIGDDSEEVNEILKEKTSNTVKQYQKEINSLNEQINSINSKNKSNWSSLNNSLFAWLSTEDSSFQVMDDQTRAIVQNLVNNLEWDSIDFDSLEDAQKYIQDNILSLFESSDGEEILPKIQMMIDTHTSFNNNELSVDEYQNKLNTLLEDINGLDSETKKSILLRFGVQLDKTNIDDMVDIVKEKLPEELRYHVEELTFEELQIAANLEISKEEVEAKLKQLEEGGNVNLTLRPQVDASKLNEKGWDASERNATVATYDNGSGTVAMNFTPVMADPKTGEFFGVLTPEELEEYAKGVISGTRKDNLNLQIGAEFTGDDAVSQANVAAKNIYRLQEQFYVDDDTLLSWDDFEERINSFKDAASNISNDNDLFGMSSISDSVKQIATQLEPQFTKLGEAYKNIFTEDGFTLDNVDTSMLEGLRKSFAEIEEDVGVAFDAEQLNSFFDTLTNSESKAKNVQDAFDDLATAYFYSTDTLARLNEETANSITKQLEELGVQNASEIVTEALSLKTETLALEKEYLAKAGYDVASAADADINALVAEQIAAGNCSQELALLQLKKMLVNRTTLDLSSDINQIITLAKAAGVGIEMLSRLEAAKTVSAIVQGGGKVPSAVLKQTQKTIQDLKSLNFNLDVGFTPNPTAPSNPTNPKDKDDSVKNKEPSKETFDLIEILISRIERKISKLDSTLSNVYKKWSTRNTALTDELKAITDEISKQEKGYNRYIKQANSVGLSDDWKKRIQNGELDIKTIDTSSDKGKKLAEKIKDYQTWYEKALACKDAIEQLREKESELYKTKFDNIVKQFDDSLNLIEHKKNMIDEAISQSEEKGYITNIRYYQKLKDIEKENLSSLQEEKKKLTQSLDDAVKSGTIKKKSEAWYEMKTQINDVKLAIEEANTALIKYNNSIRDIQWKVFDLVQEKISHITSESDFLISLMSNDKLYKDNGQLTDEGMSTMGLHGMNYNVNMARADKYQQEINDIDKKLASGVYDKNDEENVIKRRQELLELQREMILAANEEKMAIVDMVREGIEVELDALKELIDTYTEALDSQKDLYDYQKNIKDQVKEIASLEKQMTALAGDTSEENKAKLQQLKVSLEDARENLEETEYDRYISDQKKLLNDIYDEYEEILNQRLDNIDQLVSDMIDDINENAKTIVKTISDEAGAVGAKLSADMKTVWQANSVSISSVISKYGEQFSTNISSITSILNSIDASLKIAAGISSTDGSGGTGNSGSSGGTGNTSSSGNGSSGNGQNSSGSIKLSGSGNILGTLVSAGSLQKAEIDLINAKSIISHLKKKKLTAKELKSHSNLFQYIYKKSNGRAITDADILTLGKTIGVKDLPKKASGLKTKHKNKVLKKLKAVGYKKGTKHVPDDGLAWTQEGGGSEVIIRPSDGAVLTPVAKNDLVFNAAATSNLYDFMNNPNTFMQDKLKGLTPVNVSPVLKNAGSGDNLDIHLENMNISLPGVKNYEEFIDNLRKDDHVENMIRSMATIKSYKHDSVQKHRM